MNGKIRSVLGSIFVMGVTILLMGTATQSYFSDTETSTGNTFTAGTIDLAVSDNEGATWENPWVREDYEITEGDAKPCETFYDEMWLKNVGQNPMEVWKHIYNVENWENGIIEPEQDFYDENQGSELWELSDWIHYDMSLWYPNGNDWVELISESEGWFLSDDGPYLPSATGSGYSGEYLGGVECYWIYLGVLQPGEVMKVKQSYHIDGLVDNWAQSDYVTLDMEFFAQQNVGTPLPPPPGDELPGYGGP